MLNCIYDFKYICFQKLSKFCISGHNLYTFGVLSYYHVSGISHWQSILALFNIQKEFSEQIMVLIAATLFFANRWVYGFRFYQLVFLLLYKFFWQMTVLYGFLWRNKTISIEDLIAKYFEDFLIVTFTNVSSSFCFVLSTFYLVLITVNHF